jgi:hypothetical protein
MYELSRVRLCSVGPPGARYQDVLLDLSGVGRPFEHQQGALFGPGEPPRRPSPATVLFLENGGGKSVLIKLIFSVMLPGRRQVVGTTNTRVLEKFVMARDVSHVVLEWVHSETGKLLVTGKVSEWRGRVVSADPANLVDLWYCFRPSEHTHLDGLPFASDGKLVSAAGFRDRLVDAATVNPGLDLYWTRRHNDWTERLEAVGLDTELFRYQRAMNAGEGEAADAFAFTTDEVFVEFLLRAVLSDEEPKELADVVATYADNLARRGELMLERDFVDGAITLLTPLAREHAATGTAQHRAAEAYTALQALAGRIAARAVREHEALTEQQTRTDATGATERAAAAGFARAEAAVAELKRRVAQLLLDEAAGELRAAAAGVADAKLAAQAWRETDLIAKLRNATAAVRQRQELVSTSEEKAQPALAAKNAAAQALARGLLALAHDAAERAEAERALAHEKAAAAERVQADADRAAALAAAGAARADQWDERIAEVTELLAHDPGPAGPLPEGVTVTEAAAAAAEALAAAAREVADREHDAEEVEAAHEQTAAALDEARQRLRAAEDDGRRAAQEQAEATARADRLAGVPRLAEVLDTEEVILEYDVGPALPRLRAAIAEAERERTALQMSEASDEQARLALDDGQLLPPSPQILEVCRALDDEGITAWAGWDYLATVDDVEARREICERVPHLATGVVLNDPHQLPLARQILTERRLLPTTFIGIGTTEALRRSSTVEDSGSTGVAFVVPLNPALYDLDAAAEVQAAINERHADRQRRLARLDETLKGDHALMRELEAWREAYPSERLHELEVRRAAADDALRTLREAVTHSTAALERLSARRADSRAALPALRAGLASLTQQHQRLAALAAQEARVPEWTAAVAQAREEVALSTSDAARFRRAATALRDEATEHQRAADGHDRSAALAREDLRSVPGGGAVSLDEAPPAEPVDVLRETYRVAAEAYDLVEVGADLRAGLAQAEREESVARADVEALPPSVRTLATELLESPDGADASTRAAARDRAVRRLATAEERHTRAVAADAARRSELDHLPPQRDLPPSFVPPRDLEHGRELIRAAGDARAAASQQWEEAKRRLAESNQVLAAIRRSAESFSALMSAVAEVLSPATDDAPVFEGDAAAAGERYNELRTAWSTAQQAAAAAEERVRAAADELSQYATGRRFEHLATPVRQQIVGVRRTNLPEHAEEWAEALRPRLRTLTDDLAQIDRHRNGIVTRLHGMVEAALRTLRTAQRVSRLPDGLGDWSGQEFLRISFTPLEEALLVDRLGEAVDEAAKGRTGDGRDVKRDGMSLLLRGVQVAVPKGFRVDMLKPDSVLRTERERVSEVKDVFSGGQQLTAAIILYCTMAALRANNRGRVRDRHSGVLFLDNPIGRASATYLLELQRSVADALGVQLVYTTGLFDAGALSEFPLIIRLRNDADLRAGRKYLAVDDTIRHELDALDEPADDGHLSAVRMFTR